jgi:hypothetical protein
MVRALGCVAALAALVLVSAGGGAMSVQASDIPWMKGSIGKLESELGAKYGETVSARLHRGLGQVASFWRAEDGDEATFEGFVRDNFAGDQATLDAMFSRYEYLLEMLNGHMADIGLDFRRQTDLDLGPILPFDELFAAYEPSAHIGDDFFQNKIAFVVLLNFPLTTLSERLSDGQKWTRREWAEVRLAERFSKRIPSEVNLAIAKAAAASDQYIAGYNIWMYHLLDNKGRRLFPSGMRLLSHWNLRDELKADYADKKNGLAKQRMIAQVMDRIITQTIPEAVVDNANVDWNPYTNEVKPAAVSDAGAPARAAAAAPAASNAPEPDTRYAMLLGDFRASKLADPYSPTAPTLIARRFDEDREIPEERVRDMLVEIVGSPLVARVADLIKSRLGRDLEPFDVWYNGFSSQGAYTQAQLDDVVRKKYPTADAFQADLPNILVKLGFTKEKAAWIAGNIVVDPARGSGHAWGASMRGDKMHLRTRVGKDGMDYKGYNIAVHEFGHCVEQTFSLDEVDYTLLAGVPNTAFTEAFAFVFQSRDLQLLGLTAGPTGTEEALGTLNDFWSAYEIAGVALIDMAVWHWMYDHPDATPAQLKEAVIAASKDVWNRYYAPVFRRKDVPMLAIYSHMIDSFLYLPDYPIGHMIAFQIEGQMKKAGNIGSEFERMATFGSVTPDLWMEHATGSPVGPGALLAATERALAVVKGARK